MCSGALFFVDKQSAVADIITHKGLQQIVAVNAANQRTGVLVSSDISWVLRKNIADQLVDGVIALLLQRGVHARQDVVDLLVLFLRGVEFAGIVFHSVSPPSTCQYTPIFCKVKGFWASVTKP